MSNQVTPRLIKFRRFAERLWQLGLFSLVFTGPIGAGQGYSSGGMRGMLIGLMFAFVMTGVMLLVAYLILWFLSRRDRHA